MNLTTAVILSHLNENLYKALADIDDAEDIDLTKSSIDISKSDKKYNELKFVNDNFVDLDLPSGTKWCKFNVGAICGSTPESWYGNFYAWGETKPKTEYTWYTYKFGTAQTLIQYNDNDQQIDLLNNDNVIKQKYKQFGKQIDMPTIKQLEELIDNTISTYVKSYNNIKNLNGVILSSKINPDNFIFIPFAGHMCEKKSRDDHASFSCKERVLPANTTKILYIYLNAAVC